jgi:hypothetical protein
MPDLSKKFRVLLTPEMRAEFEAIVRKKSLGAAKIRRATVLLMADEAHPEGGLHDWEIAEQVGLCERQIVRIRQKFVKAGPQSTLTRAIRCDAGVRRALDGRAEAHLITIACSTAPEGRDHWTLQMLCDELKRLKIVKSVCCETVRQVLKKTNCVLGPPNASASPKRIARDSSRGWKKSSTSTRRRTTTAAR